MQQSVELVIQFGQFAMLVIVVCVAAMLLVSAFDRHPSDKRDRDDQNRKKRDRDDRNRTE
ncbi:hypothetical protein CA13_55930 [Planctomycetes bacterium CA13]|uniref:Uncharacterized protein n=1 Tax=Novipirellula herctigrandis TaxID=2527986 RepID=A0A5C5ZAK7_9BACT|nr:hypothetical protein CA13_55930 [Planctomycetes bacterium CA13]